MDKIKSLIREPALLIDAFESAVVLGIAMGLFSLSGDQQTNTVALFIAVIAIAKGLLTQPFAVTLVTDLGRAAVVWAVSLGLLSWTPDQVTVVVTFIGTVMTLIQRAQVSPRYDPVAAPTGAGSGPVAAEPVSGVSRGEEGAGEGRLIVIIAGAIVLGLFLWWILTALLR